MKKRRIIIETIPDTFNKLKMCSALKDQTMKDYALEILNVALDRDMIELKSYINSDNKTIC